jgi:PST family polysaccharide transporter
MSFTHAIKWSFLSELAAKAIQPIVFIVLARLLTPQDFGVMSAALMVIAFSQIFWEAGMSKALIQRQSDIEDAANAAFWINIGMGTVIATILFLVASPIARIFFHDERVTAVLQVMTLQVFLGATSAIHTALLQKDMGFKKLFWVRFATVSLPGLASIPLAWNGMGYWALVAGTLVGQAAQVVMLWRMSHWRPRVAFNTQVAKEMGHFGAWVGVSGLLAWFYGWADSLIVGMYLGSHELGLYRTGNQFAAMVFAILFGPITPVLYSHLSRMNQDKERLGAVIEKVIKVLTLVAIPVAIIIFSLAGPIGTTLFGEKWKGIELVIGAMVLAHGLSSVAGMNPEVYRAAGKPSYETIAMIIALPIYLVVYRASITQGFEEFVWCRLMLTAGTLWLHFFVLRRLLQTKIVPKLVYIATVLGLSALTVYFIQFAFKNEFNVAWQRVLVEGSLSLFAVGCLIWLFERDGALKDIAKMANR